MAHSDGAKSDDSRDSKGRFLPGHKKPGPGRKSPHSEAVRAVREAALEYGLPCLVEACQSGDIEAAKALCGLGLPKLRPITPMEPVTLGGETLKDTAALVMELVASGRVTCEQAQTLLSALKTVAEVQQIGDLQQRIADLESRTQGGRCGVLVTPGLVDAETWLRAAQGAIDGEG